MGELILVLGGVRSGKTRYAQRLAQEIGGDSVLFVATAEGRDGEMQARIATHRQSRSAAWRTLEAPLDVGEAIRKQAAASKVILVDCLTLLVTNAMLGLGDEPDARAAEAAVMVEVNNLLAAAQASPAAFIIVSNEVGQGVVPDYPLGRLFRDLQGMANQVVAAQAGRVYWMVAGIPIQIKPKA